MKRILVRSLAHISRLYMQYFPVKWGKVLLWHSFVQRYITWRHESFTVRCKGGARLNVTFPDAIQTYIYYFSVWEPSITNFVMNALKPGDIFVDVGANVGYYTLLSSKLVGPSGRVYALEPAAPIYAALLDNIGLNQASNVRAINMAAFDRRQSVKTFLGPGNNLGRTTIMRGVAEVEHLAEGNSIEAAPLPEIVPAAELKSARLIKIDVEGAEALVVRGMRDVIGQCSDRTEFLMEINDDIINGENESTADILDAFLANGYRAYEINNDYAVTAYIPPRKLAAPYPLQRGNGNRRDVLFSKRLIEWHP